MSKKFELYTCALGGALALSTATQADDGWTGIYFGGSLGAGQLRSSRQSSFERHLHSASRSVDYIENDGGQIGGEPYETITLRSFIDSSVYQAFGSDSGDVQPTAGALIGANYRVGPLLMGAEANLDWVNFTNKTIVDTTSTYSETRKSSQSTNGGPFVELLNNSILRLEHGQEQFKMNMNWRASAIARAGILPSDNILLYGLFGYTRAEFKALPFSSQLGFTTPFDHRDGIVLGAGIEASLGDGWSLRAEYRRTEFEEWRDKQSSTINVDNNQNYLSGHDAEIGTHIEEIRAVIVHRFTVRR